MTIPWSTGLTPATAATLAASLRPGLKRFWVVIAAYVSSPTAPAVELTAEAGATAARAATAAGSGRVTESDRTMPTANATERKPSTILISRSRRDIVVRPRSGSTEPAVVRSVRSSRGSPTATTRTHPRPWGAAWALRLHREVIARCCPTTPLWESPSRNPGEPAGHHHDGHATKPIARKLCR